jgi:hypothetical protein
VTHRGWRGDRRRSAAAPCAERSTRETPARVRERADPGGSGTRLACGQRERGWPSCRRTYGSGRRSPCLWMEPGIFCRQVRQSWRGAPGGLGVHVTGRRRRYAVFLTPGCARTAMSGRRRFVSPVIQSARAVQTRPTGVRRHELRQRGRTQSCARALALPSSHRTGRRRRVPPETAHWTWRQTSKSSARC